MTWIGTNDSPTVTPWNYSITYFGRLIYGNYLLYSFLLCNRLSTRLRVDVVFVAFAVIFFIKHAEQISTKHIIAHLQACVIVFAIVCAHYWCKNMLVKPSWDVSLCSVNSQQFYFRTQSERETIKITFKKATFQCHVTLVRLSTVVPPVKQQRTESRDTCRTRERMGLNLCNYVDIFMYTYVCVANFLITER